MGPPGACTKVDQPSSSQQSVHCRCCLSIRPRGTCEVQSQWTEGRRQDWTLGTSSVFASGHAEAPVKQRAASRRWCQGQGWPPLFATLPLWGPILIHVGPSWQQILEKPNRVGIQMLWPMTCGSLKEGKIDTERKQAMKSRIAYELEVQDQLEHFPAERCWSWR